jgi:hypothetical protein
MKRPMSQTLTNEMAFLMARELLGIVQNCLRPEEQRDAFEEFVEVCRRGLNAHETHADKMQGQLNPSMN